MDLGTILKRLRVDNNYTQADISKKLSVAPSTIGMYERNDRTPNTDILKKYTDIFNVSYDYLLGKSNKENYDNAGYTTVNVYGTVPAGIPLEAVEDIIDTEDLSFKDFSPNKTYIGLKVKGDSMYPKFLEDDTIIVEVTSDCDSYTDAVIYVNGYDATLKTVIKNPNGTITLRPINPSYPPRTYGPDDEPIKILGIVKEIRRKL